ncbi:MAG: extracellular solute-binding protein [Candidatus Limiplasma sp.]|nr:extracellular solute-binding protein [Candidatus Limiplasma sp.]
MKKWIALLLAMTLMCAMGVPAMAEEDGLKFLIQAGFYDLDSDIGWEVCQRVAGRKIDYEVLNGTEQLMLIVSSGQPYDFIYLTKENYDLMMGEEALMDIGPLLDEYGPEIKASFQTLWPAVTGENGEIWAIPSAIQFAGALEDSILVRKDLLDAAGIAMPTNLDEFYDMLVAVKAAYPDKIPLTVPNDLKVGGYFINNIASAFNLVDLWQDIDGKLVPMVNNPALEEYLAFVAKLYQEGLIDAEMPALSNSDARSKWSSGQAVMIYTKWQGTETPVGALRSLEPKMEYDVLPLMPDATGKVHGRMEYGLFAYGAIPVTCERPEETIAVINNQIKEESFTEIVLGVEGTHFEYDENGNYKLIQPAFNEEKNNSNVFVNGFLREDIYPKMWETRLTKNADLEWIFKTYKASLQDAGVKDPTALAPAVTVVGNKVALDTYVKDNLTAIVAGTKSLGDLEAVRAYWSANGGKEVEEFYNNWYSK